MSRRLQTHGNWASGYPYEEVLATKENTLPTCHERIFIAKAREYPYSNASDVVSKLTELATAVSIPEMVQLMKRTVPEF